jgi:hypothetical protein
MSQIKASTLRAQLSLAHKVLEETFAGVTKEQAHWYPSHRAHSIAANFAHVVAQEDVVINVLVQGRDPLIATQFANKSGMSELPPVPTDHIPNWQAWGDKLVVDLNAISVYCKSVFENTDAYLASIHDEELAKDVDTKFLGVMTIFDLINLTVLSNCQWHTGEISAMKGMQDLQGYPF